MPYKWNNTIVVTKDELVPTWFTWSNLKIKIHRCKSKDYGIKVVQRGGNGRKMLIAFDSLPKEIQEIMKALPIVKYDPYAF